VVLSGFSRTTSADELALYSPKRVEVAFSEARILHSPGPMRYAAPTGVGRIFLIIPIGMPQLPRRS
jgi:hypothetical protein